VITLGLSVHHARFCCPCLPEYSPVSTSAEIPEPKPVQILMEESDPIQRAYAHLELGDRALDRADRTNASRHYQHAIELAPEDALVIETTGSVRLRGVLPARRWWSNWWN